LDPYKTVQSNQLIRIALRNGTSQLTPKKKKKKKKKKRYREFPPEPESTVQMERGSASIHGRGYRSERRIAHKKFSFMNFSRTKTEDEVLSEE
jgi:hypothetical protein